MQKVQLVGILNLTPDSFSGDGVLNAQTAVKNAKQLFTNGASYLDIGAESTRPDAPPITTTQEWERLQPVLRQLVISYPGHISIDTYHPEIVKKASAEIGSFIINDVTGFNNPKMIQLAASLGLPCIVSHLPQAMGQDIQAAHRAEAKVDSVTQVRDELLRTRQKLITAGVPSKDIILDPGIGFGKTQAINRKLLAFAAEVPGIPVMIGYSKKRFLGEHRMELRPNIEAGRIAIAAGTKYLRLHGDLLAAHNAEFN
jgi:dihydropteroate synthase